MNENLCRLVAEHLNTEESKQERASLAQRVIAVLGVLCFIVLVGVATNAYAETMKYENRYGSIRLFDRPCEIDVDGKAGLKAAAGVFTQVMQTPYGQIPVGQVSMKGCWKRAADGYESVWEDGEKIKYPFGEFHPEGV